MSYLDQEINDLLKSVSNGLHEVTDEEIKAGEYPEPRVTYRIAMWTTGVWVCNGCNKPTDIRDRYFDPNGTVCAKQVHKLDYNKFRELYSEYFGKILTDKELEQQYNWAFDECNMVSNNTEANVTEELANECWMHGYCDSTEYLYTPIPHSYVCKRINGVDQPPEPDDPLFINIYDAAAYARSIGISI